MEVKNNYNYANTTVTLFNDEIHDTIGNFTFDLKYNLEKLQLQCSLKIQGNGKDESYKLEVFRTSMNADKFLDGRSGSNFVAKALMENYQSAAAFDINFPWKKVNFCLIYIP